MNGAADQPTPTQNSLTGGRIQGLDRRILFALAIVAAILTATILVYWPGLGLSRLTSIDAELL